MKLSGYAAVFDEWTLVGGDFHERVRPGAFKRTLASNREVFLIHHHSYETVLATTANSTLQLSEDS